MTSEDRGSDADSGGVADKDDLQRAVEERVAAVEAAAASEPVVNAPKQEQTAGTGATTSPTERVTPEKSTADSPVTANPVVAPAPIAEPGDAAGAPAPQPGPPSHDPTRPNTPRVTDEGDE